MKRSVLVDQHGALRAAVVADATVPDQRLLAATLEAPIRPRPPPTGRRPRPRPCASTSGTTARRPRGRRAYGYRPHLRRIGEETRDPGAGATWPPARRWVVERARARLSRCRTSPGRYEKKAANYLGLVKVAAILLWYRRWGRPTRTG